METVEHIYTPTELLRETRMHIEMGFPRVLLEAEISNLSRPASGHLYFTLKDNKAQVRCALFRSSANRLAIRPENGMKVIARGRLSLYEARGDFQMIVDGLRDAGEGDLQRQFEALKKKLEAEGLFEAGLKQPLPAYPSRIAVITSPGGAAVRDILHILERRWPLARVRIHPATVQGDTAAGELMAALAAANEQGWADVIIMGRGGGSLEDLAAFNDESLARSVVASNIPVVSAVGHETDFSICDFVADLRAPTPSAAAELVSPDREQLIRLFDKASRQLQSRVEQRIRDQAQRIDHCAHRLNQQHPERGIQRARERLLDLNRRLRQAAHLKQTQTERLLEQKRHRLEVLHPGRRLESLRSRVNSAANRLPGIANRLVQPRREHLKELARTLNAVSPLQVLARGYAALSDTAGREIVTRAIQVSPGDQIRAQLADGSLDCTVDQVRISPVGDGE